MSVRYLYRKVPREKLICSYYGCRQVIQRNIARDKDGHLYHYGCLMNAKDKHWECLDCYARFNGTKVTVTNFGDPQQVKCCGFCGSSNIHPSHSRRKVGPHSTFPSPKAGQTGAAQSQETTSGGRSSNKARGTPPAIQPSISR